MARLGAIALIVILAGCSGGGGGGDSPTNPGAVVQGSRLTLTSSSPAAGSRQVETSTEPTLHFDGALVPESFASSACGLFRLRDGTRVAGRFAAGTSPLSVRFLPDTALETDTAYELQVGPLACDRAGRIVDQHLRVGFHTVDAVAPRILGATLVGTPAAANRREAIRLRTSEPVDETSLVSRPVLLRDARGAEVPVDVTLEGDELVVQPRRDLEGAMNHVLTVTAGLRDLAGNGLAPVWQLPFQTVVDNQPPQLVSSLPLQGMLNRSPVAPIALRFDESLRPSSGDMPEVTLQAGANHAISCSCRLDESQRVLWVDPDELLPTNTDLSLRVSRVADLSGNTTGAPTTVSFRTGSDSTAPTATSTSPAAGSTGHGRNAPFVVAWSEPMDAASATSGIRWQADGLLVSWTLEVRNGGTLWVLSPQQVLPAGVACSLTLPGGREGVRDTAGNPLSSELRVEFLTTGDETLPTAVLVPANDSHGVPLNARIVAMCDSPIDPGSVDANDLTVATESGMPVPGTTELRPCGRMLRFVPATALPAGTLLVATLADGAVRETAGNAVEGPLQTRFRTGFAADTTAPQPSLTVNEVSTLRNQGLLLPTHGFTIDLTAASGAGQELDLGSTVLALNGPGTAPASADLLSHATVSASGISIVVPAALQLAPGTWQLGATVEDLAGNRATCTPVTFEVTEPTGKMLPFERLQVVWLRADLDRNGNGTPDFEEDMLRLGLASSGDPRGTNAWVRNQVLEGIVAKAHELFGRNALGDPLGAHASPIRFTLEAPVGLPHMQVAIGGLDPFGNPSRTYGDASTGVLGRARYDHRNQNLEERNTDNGAGLGVFPAEMFLYQARVHRQLYPYTITWFAQRFMSLCPAMGGTAAGSGPLDGEVLRNGFEWATANSTAQARWSQVLTAADDWAVVTGIITAHEVGHSLGLVAPGASPNGLLGDNSLHESTATAADVMSASVGYEAMLSLPYRFRDLSMAYLRQRILLR
ncbi:MAG: hypothetical protein RL148_921 [Planctomycetota bacterium]